MRAQCAQYTVEHYCHRRTCGEPKATAQRARITYLLLYKRVSMRV